jgi:hypothetical protein
MQECHLLSRSFLAELVFSTLHMEWVSSSETSVDTQRTTRCYIPEDCTLHDLFVFLRNNDRMRPKEVVRKNIKLLSSFYYRLVRRWV